MTEFADGILLFAVKNKNIWEKAKNDEEGLNTYFKNNRKKYSFESPQYKGIIVHAKNETILKEAEELYHKAKDAEDFINILKNTLNKDSVTVKTERGVWGKGENQYVDNKVFSENLPPQLKEYPYFFVSGKLIEAPEEYKDVKAAVELDYQEKLEKEWEAYLRKKYKVDINNSVLKSIK